MAYAVRIALRLDLQKGRDGTLENGEKYTFVVASTLGASRRRAGERLDVIKRAGCAQRGGRLCARACALTVRKARRVQVSLIRSVIFACGCGGRTLISKRAFQREQVKGRKNGGTGRVQKRTNAILCVQSMSTRCTE